MMLVLSVMRDAALLVFVVLYYCNITVTVLLGAVQCRVWVARGGAPVLVLL